MSGPPPEGVKVTLVVLTAAENVPERHYTHHEGRGPTPHRSNPKVIHRELAALKAGDGMRVLEIGTGSGYSGAVLAELVGKNGRVVSLDIAPYLTRWANLIHHERRVEQIGCFTGDGTAGYPQHAPYDRLISWCTPEILPAAWAEQVRDGGLIVTPLPIAAVPNMTVVATIRVTDRQPRVESIAAGGYIDATASPKINLDVPGRWVDWEYRVPAPSWISIAWRDADDRCGTTARRALDWLRDPGYQVSYLGDEIDWPSWRTFAAATEDRHLTMVGLAPDLWAIGHSTQTSAAVIQQDGQILADGPKSPSLTALRGWLADWEAAERPAPTTYHPTLIGSWKHRSEVQGWRLQLSR